LEIQSVLPADTFPVDEDSTSLLPESISITRIEELLEQMRIKEIPKRTFFSIPFHLAEGFTIGVKGYVLFLRLLGNKSIMCIPQVWAHNRAEERAI
jgi:hypothetical protein